MTKVAKHEKLYENLKKVIIELNPNDRFISLREIMQRFDVSQATVSSAIIPLYEERLLEKRRGLGMYVTSEVMKYKPSALPVIAFAVPLWMSSVYWQLENIFLELQEQLGFSGEVIHYDWREGTIRKLPNRKIDGLIVLPAAHFIKTEQFQALNGFNIPYLILGQSLKSMNVNAVYCDEEFGGALAADHLVKLGHRKLAILVTEPWGEPIHDRVRGFSQYCEQQDTPVEVIDCNSKYGDSALVKTYEKMKELCKSGKPDFTGMFVVSDEPCQSVFKALHEAGIKIPGDISVISFSDSPCCPFYYPALTTVSTGLSKQMAECISNIKAVIANNVVQPIKKCMKAEIIVRESTGPKISL